MQCDPADKLDIVVHHVPRQHMLTHVKLLTAHPAGRVLHRRKGLRQQVVERLTILMALHELSGLGAQLPFRKRLIFNFKCVDTLGNGQALFKKLLVVTS